MKEIFISEAFKSEYLTCGKTYDNYIFENCPLEFIKEARLLLKKKNNDVKPCNITITRSDELYVEETLKNCSEDLQRKLICRDYICALIMQELLQNENLNKDSLEEIQSGLAAINNCNWAEVKTFHMNCPMPYDITRSAKKLGKIEINFFLIDTENIFIQQAVNIFISSREPYSVKIFTSNERLPSYYDQMGNIIQCPHDYMTRDVNQFIELDDTVEK